MYLIKSVLLDWYSDKKIIFRMIRWNLASKNDSELWKFPIFDSSDSKSLTRYQKILWICSLECKKSQLNFAWHSMKFHSCHHAIAGAVYDIAGNYDTSFYIASASFVLASILGLVAQFLQRLQLSKIKAIEVQTISTNLW